MAHFEFVNKYKDCGLDLPKRGTRNSAGYDLTIVEDIIVPRYEDATIDLMGAYANGDTQTLMSGLTKAPVLDLSTLADLTKKTHNKPTLVSTGVKCYLDEGEYLELSVRSSTPLKYWLILANSVGIIDADYADNPDNEGEIFLQLINLSPFDIQLHKGDKIGQAIIHKYEITDSDNAEGKRIGGFGSTSK